MTELWQKVAFVTGSSRGIGAAIAMRFAERGAKVALHGRDVVALSAVRAAIEASGGQAIQVTGDVTKLDENERMHREVETKLGPIDVLVANAGGNQTKPHLALEEIPEQGFRASLENNLIATFLTLKSVLPRMKERKTGSIITVSSAAARRPNP